MHEKWQCLSFFFSHTGNVECSSSCRVSTWSQRLWLWDWKCPLQLGVGFKISWFLISLPFVQLQWALWKIVWLFQEVNSGHFLRQLFSSVALLFLHFYPLLCLWERYCGVKMTVRDKLLGGEVQWCVNNIWSGYWILNKSRQLFRCNCVDQHTSVVRKQSRCNDTTGYYLQSRFIENLKQQRKPLMLQPSFFFYPYVCLPFYLNPWNCTTTDHKCSFFLFSSIVRIVSVVNINPFSYFWFETLSKNLTFHIHKFVWYVSLMTLILPIILFKNLLFNTCKSQLK